MVVLTDTRVMLLVHTIECTINFYKPPSRNGAWGLGT